VEEWGFEPGLAFGRRLDAEDDLASSREAFVIADPDLIYVDGNSLGRLPRRTVERMRTAVEVEWGRDLIPATLPRSTSSS
jgi:kynureninase